MLIHVTYANIAKTLIVHLIPLIMFCLGGYLVNCQQFNYIDIGRFSPVCEGQCVVSQCVMLHAAVSYFTRRLGNARPSAPTNVEISSKEELKKKKRVV